MSRILQITRGGNNDKGDDKNLTDENQCLGLRDTMIHEQQVLERVGWSGL